MTAHHNTFCSCDVVRHQNPTHRHNLVRHYKICTGAALLRPKSARSIRPSPVAAVVFQTAGFRLNTTDTDVAVAKGAMPSRKIDVPSRPRERTETLQQQS
jgi:hypothetical protein